MRCPYCGADESKVIDSRPTEDGEKIRRRRECLSCKKRFTTYEIVETVPLMVIKKDRSREVFDRQKLLNGMLRACEKRPVSYSIHRMDAEFRSGIFLSKKHPDRKPDCRPDRRGNQLYRSERSKKTGRRTIP